LPARLHHLDLPMGDFEATERFYGDVLGWPIGQKSAKGPRGWVDFKEAAPEGTVPQLLTVEFEDGSYLAFVIGKEPDYSGDLPCVGVTLRDSNERRDLLERLNKAGVKTEGSASTGFAFYDPAGLRIEVR
jgi:catechol 2,3-dioxygenase-like lactoylglutathione lyase family enzyme